MVQAWISPVEVALTISDNGQGHALLGAEAAQLWARVGECIQGYEGRYVTFAALANKRGLVRLYDRVASGRIYTGPWLGAGELKVYYLSQLRIRLLRATWQTGLLQPLLFRKPDPNPASPIRRWYPLGWLKRLRRPRR